MMFVSRVRAITFLTAGALTVLITFAAVVSAMVGHRVLNRDVARLMTLATGVLWVAHFAAGYRDTILRHIDERAGATVAQVAMLHADLDRLHRQVTALAEVVGEYGDSRETDGRVKMIHELGSSDGSSTTPIRAMRPVNGHAGTAN
jgi:hypothetical protein